MPLRCTRTVAINSMSSFHIFSTCTNPIIHLFTPKILHNHCLQFLLGRMKMSQRKSKTMPMQFFLGGGGRGDVEAVYYDIVQVENFL